jgi:TetR/AcrR family transcriptional regulator, lmrAB and yxaGH operons repressor
LSLNRPSVAYTSILGMGNLQVVRLPLPRGVDDSRHLCSLATVAESMTVVIGRRYDGVMQAKNTSSSETGNRRRSPARARMVRSAAMLMRERGIHGVGLREVVTHSGGPLGSFGRFFPGGKTQLMIEAIDVALAGVYDELDRTLAEAETFPDAIGMIVAPWRRVLVDHVFALGCPLAATVVDAADNDDLRVHVSELLDRWQASVADVYVKFGEPPAIADEQSTVLLAALEGALILARARRSTEPLDAVERFFGAGAPRSAAPNRL